jgi:uncharacterized protein (TIGR03067 family)
MKLRTLPVLLVVLLLGADKKEPALKGDQKKLQGIWKATKIVYNGDELSADNEGKIKITIKGTTLTLEAAKQIKREYATIQIKLDETTTPKCIDATISAGGKKGVTLESIYKLDGDKLTICTKVLGMDRPTKFESPGGESVALVELERVKD